MKFCLPCALTVLSFAACPSCSGGSSTNQSHPGGGSLDSRAGDAGRANQVGGGESVDVGGTHFDKGTGGGGGADQTGEGGLAGASPGEGPVARYDIVVYGATAAGVVAAVAAAREGAHVALVEPGRHLGGMVSGGLGWTDFGNRRVVGGMSLEFFHRAGKKYGAPVAWQFEPHVAEAVFKEMVAEANVAVIYGERLRALTGVEKTGTRLQAIHSESGATYAADVFIDASYEGDLMAQAQVSYTWGRESTAAYNETLAGVRSTTPLHQFTVDVSPFDAGGGLLALVQPGPKGEVGAADHKVQAYNFRLCLTDVPENRLPFPQPSGYDAKRYTLLARLIAALTAKTGTPPKLTALMKLDRVPNGKTDVNNNGAVSTDYIGGSWDYPEASYAQREKIWQDHLSYTQGLFYFLANDPQVPASLRDQVNEFGPSKDEFGDTDHWPHQLYVREARRMIGEYVMSQNDIQTDLTKNDSIGMGSYNSDSHNVQRFPTAAAFVANEGDMQVSVAPYQIPYGMLLPKRAEATNLLVPVAFSASHVAYSTLRMEPQYMIIGQAAGIAAQMAASTQVDVQEIDVTALRDRLTTGKAVLSLL